MKTCGNSLLYLSAGICIAAGSMLWKPAQHNAIAECNHNVVVNSNCLPESAWRGCGGPGTARENCTSAQMGSWATPLGKKYASGSNTHVGDPVTQERVCYVIYDCQWYNHVEYGLGCYPDYITQKDIKENVPIYTASKCEGE